MKINKLKSFEDFTELLDLSNLVTQMELFNHLSNNIKNYQLNFLKSNIITFEEFLNKISESDLINWEICYFDEILLKKFPGLKLFKENFRGYNCFLKFEKINNFIEREKINLYNEKFIFIPKLKKILHLKNNIKLNDIIFQINGNYLEVEIRENIYYNYDIKIFLEFYIKIYFNIENLQIDKHFISNCYCWL